MGVINRGVLGKNVRRLIEHLKREAIEIPTSIGLSEGKEVWGQ